MRAKSSVTPFQLSRRHRLAPLVPLERLAGARAETLVELAWNGQRVLFCRVGDVVRVFSEDLREWTDSFPTLVEAVRRLPARELALEGFVCAFDGARPSFERLRAHIAGRARPRLLFAASDLTHLDGADLRASSPLDRRAALTRLLAQAKEPLALSGALEGDLDSLVTRARALGAPGLVVRTDAGVFSVLLEGASREHLSPPPIVTNADKVLYPRDGFTKQTIVDYYRDVAPVLLPYMKDRPVVGQRWPDGIDDFTWYQHRLPPKAPDYLRSVPVAPRERRFVIDDVDGLLWMVNQAVLTFHGWQSRVPHLDSPDWLLLDLDPAEGTPYDEVVAVALAVQKLLELLELPSVPKTSGKKGLHVLVPLAPGHGLEEVNEVARRIATVLARTLPDRITLETQRERRGGRVYLDHLQKFVGKSLVLPYSLRAADGATVSTPLRWSEVKPGLDPRAFTLRTLRARLDAVGDLALPLLQGTTRLRTALARLPA